jgi:hypothetical protein
VIPSFFSGSVPASVAHFSRSRFPNTGVGARLTLGAAAGDEAARDTYFAVFEGVDFRGRSVGQPRAEGWRECAALCLQTTECTGFSFTHEETPICDLKADIAGPVRGGSHAGVLFHGWPKDFSTINRELIFPVVYKVIGVAEKR